MTSVNVFAWGAGGGGSSYPPQAIFSTGGGGGFSTGTLAVTGGQTFDVVVGEGGKSVPSTTSDGIPKSLGGGGGGAVTANPSYCNNVDIMGASGGGLSGVFSNSVSFPGASSPQAFIVAGAGGGGGYGGPKTGRLDRDWETTT